METSTLTIALIVIFGILPIVLSGILNVIDFINDVGITRVLVLVAIAIGAFLLIQKNDLPNFDTDGLDYTKNLRLSEDPYKNMMALVEKGDLEIKPTANVRSLRAEMTNIIPVVISAYRTVLGDNYVPTITSGNDSEEHSYNSKHYENLALDWRTNDITYRQALRVTRLIKQELEPAAMYWIALEDDHIHIHYRITSVQTKYNDIIFANAKKQSIEVALVMAVVRKESAFDPKATSDVGAQGLMQLMPGTAREQGVRDSYDPHDNVKGGTKYLRKMLNRYDNNVELALAAYNSGPGNIDKAIKKAGSRNWRVVKNNLVTPEIHQKQTIDYVSKISSFKKVYSYLYPEA